MLQILQILQNTPCYKYYMFEINERIVGNGLSILTITLNSGTLSMILGYAAHNEQ